MEDAVTFLTEQLNLRREIRVQTVANATSNSSAVTDWDDPAGTPLADIALYKGAMLASIGRLPTHLLAGSHVWEQLAAAKGVTDKTMYQPFWNVLEATGTKLVSMPILGLTPVSAGALYNSAQAGATVAAAWVWGDAAYLIRVDGATRGLPWAIQPYVNDYVVTRWRDDEIGGWWIKIEHKIGFKEVTPGAIYEIDDVT
jgi:hypothetical protein